MAEPPLLVPIPLETIRRAYHELGRSVNRDLLTQVGDSARLEERKRECLNLLRLVRQVCPHLFYSSLILIKYLAHAKHSS